jgi:osmotically-inducible protein OsmY
MIARERPSAQGYYPPYGYERDDSDRQPSDRPTRPRQDRQGRYLADRQSPGRSTRRQRTALSQSALAGRVRNRLIETLSGAENVRVLPPGDVCVVVEGGDVTLVGSVGDSAERRRAERAVRSLQGVDRVRNYLTIGGREDRTTSQRLATRGNSEQRAGRQSPRRSLAAEVAEQLRRDLPRPRQIMVTADRGTVTLRGAVQTPQQKRIAQEIARGIYGVRKVRNRLNIGIETGEYPPLAYTDGRPSRIPRGN